MQMVGLGFVFGWYAIRDRYGHDCDHGDHTLIALAAQSPMSLGSPLTGARSTIILYRCRYCIYVESATIDGAWPIGQIRAWGNGVIPDMDWAPEPDTEPVMS
jgi:hypothetical protein